MNRPAFFMQKQRRGFTLIELMIVIAIIAILLSVAVPIYSTHLRRANEAALKQDLFSMRQAIDQYSQDKMKAPQSLQDLVSAGYLRALPKDPFTNSDSTWQAVQEDVLTSIDQQEPGISDVKSGSNLVSSEGTPYSSW
jgi:general secretion pathway protein G